MLINWRSGRLTRVARSPFRAEALVMSDCLDWAKWMMLGAGQMGLVDPGSRPFLITEAAKGVIWMSVGGGDQGNQIFFK